MDKLQIRVLPCLVFFVNGVAVGRVTGFEALGNRDDFTTAQLEKLLLAGGVVQAVAPKAPGSDDEGAGRCVCALASVRVCVLSLPLIHVAAGRTLECPAISSTWPLPSCSPPCEGHCDLAT